MKCKYHPEREGELFCTGCNVPLCKECAEDAGSGKYYCFQCAMLHSVSEVGTSIIDKRGEAARKKLKEKEKWGPFRYFIISASVLILVMWGIILFGGQKAPHRTAGIATKGRVLLFMVNGALKRYAHYEGNKYPEKLSNLIPKYLSLRKDEIFYLDKLSYKRVSEKEYKLSLARSKPGEMNIIISPRGIEYTRPSSG